MNGFLFSEHTLPSFIAAIDRTLLSYGNRKKWTGIVRNAMGTDFSWTSSAARYVELYKEMTGNG